MEDPDLLKVGVFCGFQVHSGNPHSGKGGGFLAAEVEAAALVPLSSSLQDVVKLAAPDFELDRQSPDSLLELSR